MLADRQAGIGRLLGEVADAVAGVRLDRPAIGLGEAGQDTEQGGLPGTVRADQAYAVAVTEDERNGIEERSGVVRRTERVCFQHGPSSLFAEKYSGWGQGSA
jgi:hypothetical protein